MSYVGKFFSPDAISCIRILLLYRLIAEKINKNERKSKSEIIVMPQGSEEKGFWKALNVHSSSDIVLIKVGWQSFCWFVCNVFLSCPFTEFFFFSEWTWSHFQDSSLVYSDEYFSYFSTKPYEPGHNISCKIPCAPTEDADQPVHLHSLCRDCE